MNRDHAPWRALETADIRWLHDTPQSEVFDDIYYSREDGLNETRHVFLAPAGIPERWQHHPHNVFCIGETGFGTGLNFLATWQCWREHQAHTSKRLHFISAENCPLTQEDLHRALIHWPDLGGLAQELIAQYPQPLPGQHRLVFDKGTVTLDLYFEDVEVMLAELAPQACVDAWYLDGFAPDKNPAMWQDTLFQAMAQASRAGATVSTFTAAGFVRRGLGHAGFDMRKTQGFGRKREQLNGALIKASTSYRPATTPWHRIGEPGIDTVSDCIVIGAGLAGCTTAAALARRGVRVTLFDRDGVATGASGNSQGVLYTRLSLAHSPLQDFSLSSFSFASRFYRQLLDSATLTIGLHGDLCGSFHQHSDEAFLDAISERLSSLPELARVLNADDASELLSNAQHHRGIYFPESGWINPQAACQALLQNALIDIRTQYGALHLQRRDQHWQVLSKGSDKPLAQSANVVIACGTDSAQFEPTQWLPLRPIRGQTTLLPATNLPALASVLCHKGYIAPALDDHYCIGASFDMDDADLTLRTDDHQHNIELLKEALPEWRPPLSQLTPESLTGRVGLRCASPDYLPIAGPVPDYDGFLHRYGKLRKNARTVIDLHGVYWPGLYVNTAHGSRGLTSTPLIAELLAGLICKEPLALPSYLQQAISPGRFIIRDLIRNRI